MRRIVVVVGVLLVVLAVWWAARPPERPRVVLVRPAHPKSVVTHTAPEPAAAPVAAPPAPPSPPAADAPPEEPTLAVGGSMVHAYPVAPMPTEPLTGDALEEQANVALVNAGAFMCALQYGALTGVTVDDDLDLDVTLDGDGLVGAELVGAEDVPAQLASCYADALWSTDWPKAAGGPQVITLRLQAQGVGIPGGVQLVKPTVAVHP